MRRALPAAVMSAAGLGLVLTFKTSPAVSGTRVATKAPSAQPSAAAPPTSAEVASSSPGATAVTVGPRPPSTPVVATAAAPPKPTAATVPIATAAGATSAGSGTFAGETMETRFGPIQVQVTLQSGKIVDVVELQVPNDRRRSIAINNAAGPILREEVLQAQSANIDTVSGATVTSDAYAQSLQAALDQAHFAG